MIPGQVFNITNGTAFILTTDGDYLYEFIKQKRHAFFLKYELVSSTDFWGSDRIPDAVIENCSEFNIQINKDKR